MTIKSNLKICLTKRESVCVGRCHPRAGYLLTEVKCVHTQTLGEDWRTEKKQLRFFHLEEITITCLEVRKVDNLSED